MKMVFFGGLMCAFFSITTTFAMQEDDGEKGQLFEVVIDDQYKLNSGLEHGAHIYLKKVKKPKQELPSMSLGCKIFSGLCTTGLCVGTTIAAGLGEWATVLLVDDYKTDDNDHATPIMAGTTVGLGICALGVCTYGCGAAITNWVRGRQAEKQRQSMHFQVSQDESVV